MGKDDEIGANELQRSLNLVITAFVFGVSFFVIAYPGASPFGGFTRALGVNDFLYGLITAIPILSNVIQIFASYYIENTGKRKSTMIIFGLIHRLLWIPIALIPLLVPSDYNTLRIWSIIVLIALSSAASSFVGVAFFSWMGALVPSEIRGRFFSRRTMLCTISGALAGLVSARFLDVVKGFNGFAIVFIAAAILGAIDIMFFVWIKNPPMKIPDEKIPFLKLFLIPFKNKNYIYFISFISILNFGVQFAGPFFLLYMLEYLKMGYLLIYMFTQLVSNITTVLCIGMWGKLVDRYGNKPVLTICCSVVVILPFLWSFAIPENFWVIIFINLLGGVFWPGIELTATNLSIWLAPEKNRSIYLANYTLIVSLAGVAFAFICGGWFMQYVSPVIKGMNMPFIMGQRFSGYHALFIISGLIRLFAVLVLLPKLKEENSKSAGHVLKRFIKSRQAGG